VPSAFPASFSVPTLVASGYHAPLTIALPVVAVVVIGRIAFARARGRPALAGRIVVRCSRGHLFRVLWSPLGSLTSIRLGAARFQRCPVGNHWSLVRPVNEADLTEEERQTVAERDA
jgi:hypothetical protein